MKLGNPENLPLRRLQWRLETHWSRHLGFQFVDHWIPSRWYLDTNMAALEICRQIRAVPYDFMAALGSMGCHWLPVLTNFNHSWSCQPLPWDEQGNVGGHCRICEGPVGCCDDDSVQLGMVVDGGQDTQGSWGVDFLTILSDQVLRKDHQSNRESSHISWGFNASGSKHEMFAWTSCMIDFFYFWCFCFSSSPCFVVWREFLDRCWLSVLKSLVSTVHCPCWRCWSFRRHHVVKVMQPLVCTLHILVSAQQSKDPPWEAPVILPYHGELKQRQSRNWNWTSSNFSPLKEQTIFK